MCRYLGGAVHHTLTDWKDSVGGVTKGGQRRGELPPTQQARGAKKPDHKYFMTIEDKNECERLMRLIFCDAVSR